MRLYITPQRPSGLSPMRSSRWLFRRWPRSPRSRLSSEAKLDPALAARASPNLFSAGEKIRRNSFISVVASRHRETRHKSSPDPSDPFFLSPFFRYGGLKTGGHDIFREAPARTSAFPCLFPLEAAFVNGDGSFAVVLSESGGVMAGQHFDLSQTQHKMGITAQPFIEL